MSRRDRAAWNPRHSLWMVLAGLLVLQPGRVTAGVWAALADTAAHSDLVTETFREPLAQFYADRQGQPLWFNSTRPSPKAGELLAVLADAASEGLEPAEYLPDVLQQVCGPQPPQDPMDCELRLSDSLLRYARDVAFGSLPAAEADPDWHIPQRQLPVAQLLAGISDADELNTVLRELPPPHAAYRQLREALANYRESEQASRPMVPEGPLLRSGDRGGRVRTLRARLAAEQPDLADAVDRCAFDDRLRAAVEAFQARHGLAEDGVVGPQTLAALNVPVSERISELRLNMERWRWLPRELGGKYILVNLAGFELTLAQSGQTPLRMRVIGGRPDRSTPTMQSAVRQLVLNPEWTVPRRIAVEDLLPQLQRDPLALRAKNIKVLAREEQGWSEIDPQQIDWNRHHVDNFPFVLRQAAGRGNSLGRIKFNMSNAFDIYLHDTPARGLFRKPLRAFSSGCIRVEKPLRLAAHLFDGDADRIGAWLWRRIDRGDTDRLRVNPSVPVYLVYLTAWVDDVGAVQFREDVYRRNAQLRHKFATETGG